MAFIYKSLTAVALFVLPATAMGQIVIQRGGDATNVHIKCADYQRNQDGSWAPVHAVTINGTTLNPGVSFSEGQSFGGVNLAAQLNQHCR